MSEKKKPERIIELLQRIAVLAAQGVDGEASAAQRKLDVLLMKHGLTMADLEANTRKQCSFKFRGKAQRTLFANVVGHVVGHGESRILYDNSCLYADLTVAESIDVDILFNHFRKEYNREVKRLMAALIYRHGLFPATPRIRGPFTAKEFEEGNKAMKMANGLSSNDVLRKQLSTTA